MIWRDRVWDLCTLESPLPCALLIRGACGSEERCKSQCKISEIWVITWRSRSCTWAWWLNLKRTAGLVRPQELEYEKRRGSPRQVWRGLVKYPMVTPGKSQEFFLRWEALFDGLRSNVHQSVEDERCRQRICFRVYSSLWTNTLNRLARFIRVDATTTYPTSLWKIFDKSTRAPHRSLLPIINRQTSRKSIIRFSQIMWYNQNMIIYIISQ
jgi:hypothetical protein